MLLKKTYGIDLGNSSMKVYSFLKNKSYIEKNMIASKGRRIIAVGNEAYEMFEKSPSDIQVNSPMAFGMIANLELQEIALYSMLRKIDKIPSLGSDMYFSVPHSQRHNHLRSLRPREFLTVMHSPSTVNLPKRLFFKSFIT